MTYPNSLSGESVVPLNSTRRSTVALAIAAGAGLAALTACSTEAPKPEFTQTQEAPKNMFEEIEDRIENRAAPGTPEYIELQTERYVIPYVEGQAPEEVVQRFSDAMYNWDEAGLVDGPKNEKEAVEWMLNAYGSSVQDLVNTTLELDYHNVMAAEAIFGKDFRNNEFSNTAFTNLSSVHADRLISIYVGNIDPNRGRLLVDPGISLSSDESIVGYLKYSNVEGEASFSYTLESKDTDNDGTKDAWIFTGPGQ